MSDEGVQRYIDMKRNVVRNMGRVQNLLAGLQAALPDEPAAGVVLRRIQSILDDPFVGDGLPSSP